MDKVQTAEEFIDEVERHLDDYLTPGTKYELSKLVEERDRALLEAAAERAMQQCYWAVPDGRSPAEQIRAAILANPQGGNN